mgnify:CR=1 FL=1
MTADTYTASDGSRWELAQSPTIRHEGSAWHAIRDGRESVSASGSTRAKLITDIERRVSERFDAVRHCEPWIGNVLDGQRSVLLVYDHNGRDRYVTVEDILRRCVLHDTANDASTQAGGERTERVSERAEETA